MQILGILSGFKISVDPSRTFSIYLVKNRPYCTLFLIILIQNVLKSRPPIVFCVAQHPQSEKRTWRVYRFNNICRLPINRRGYNIVITFYRSRKHPHTHTNKCSHIHTPTNTNDNHTHSSPHACTHERALPVPDEISNSLFAFRPDTFECETNDNEQNRDVGQ